MVWLIVFRHLSNITVSYENLCQERSLHVHIGERDTQRSILPFKEVEVKFRNTYRDRDSLQTLKSQPSF